MKPLADRGLSLSTGMNERGAMSDAVRRQSGITLIELVVALAIISLIGGGIVGSVHQLLTTSRQANSQQYAISQLRQAENVITRDVLMTWTVPEWDVDTCLKLSWKNPSETDLVVVTYTLAGPEGSARVLWRQLVATDIATGTVIADHTTLVASGIHEDSGCTFEDSVLTVTLMAPRDQSAVPSLETRIIQVKPRKTDLLPFPLS